MAASPSGSRSPLRTAGIALLGVGIVAATAGLFASVTTGNGAGTAVPSASSQALPATAASAAPAPSPAPPPAAPAAPGTAPAASPPAVAAPAPAPQAAPPPPPVRPAPAAGAGGTGGASAVRAPLRVFNNSLVPKLAAEARSDFEARGWTVLQDGNYSEEQGVVATSTAFFRPGTGEESAAHELGREFGLRVAPRDQLPGTAPAADGVIVLLAQDFKAAAK